MVVFVFTETCDDPSGDELTQTVGRALNDFANDQDCQACEHGSLSSQHGAHPDGANGGDDTPGIPARIGDTLDGGGMAAGVGDGIELGEARTKGRDCQEATEVALVVAEDAIKKLQVSN